MCFFASLVELLWDNGKGETIQEQIALINIVFIVQSIKVISLDASLPLRRQKYCVSASLSLEEAGGQWGRQWVIMSGMHIYLFTYVYTYTGFPGGARGKEPSYQWRRWKKCRFNPWVEDAGPSAHREPLCLSFVCHRGLKLWDIASEPLCCEQS